MIKMRRYKKEDIDNCVEGINQFLLENRGTDYQNNYAELDLDRKKLYTTLVSRVNDPHFFLNILVNDEDEILGALCAEISAPIFSSQLLAYDHIIYMNPGFVNIRGLITLINAYKSWAQDMGAVRWRLSTTTGFETAKFTKLCQRIGMAKIGEDFEGTL